MNRIRSIEFHEHPILGNLSLDFCDNSGKAVDTVILAGENGTGKSTIIDALFALTSNSAHHAPFAADVVFEIDDSPIVVQYSIGEVRKESEQFAKIANSRKKLIYSEEIKDNFATCAIYSDVAVTFQSGPVTTISSMTLDSLSESQRSSASLALQIKQLFVDIQSLDDTDISRATRLHPDTPLNNLAVEQRMHRFTNAFKLMFDDLSYEGIKTAEGQKDVLFKKNEALVSIDALSSGEKQIIYRGCFLLKDKNALNGAFVFIDEPEISLHPKWQIKIMDYYKSMFTNSEGAQESQVFAVTHSPFLIHNEKRKNDKVIVLYRDENGVIQVQDKPEYYRCESVAVVEDAFRVKTFTVDRPVVYVEGQTDEKYFNSALKAFSLSVPFEFKWIGYIDEAGQVHNSGESALKHAQSYLSSQQSITRVAFLYDCDVGIEPSVSNNILELGIQPHQSSWNIKKGVENALVLDTVEKEPFYKSDYKLGDYGEKKEIPIFKKMELCDHICSLPLETQRDIFINLRQIIEELAFFFNNGRLP